MALKIMIALIILIVLLLCFLSIIFYQIDHTLDRILNLLSQTNGLIGYETRDYFSNKRTKRVNKRR